MADMTSFDRLNAGQAAATTPLPSLSTGALIFGAALFGPGLAGLVQGATPLDWGTSFACGFVGAGTVVLLALLGDTRRRQAS